MGKITVNVTVEDGQVKSDFKAEKSTSGDLSMAMATLKTMNYVLLRQFAKRSNFDLTKGEL